MTNTIEYYVQRPRQDARRGRITTSLYGVGLSRIGDTVGKQQGVLTMEQVLNEW